MTGIPAPALPTRNVVAQVSDQNQQMIRWFEDVTAVARTGVPDGDKGDIGVSGQGTVWTVNPGAITLEKMADLHAGTIVGNATGAADVPDALTPAEVRTLINVADGATANQTDAFLLDRTNHTGTQTAATIGDFSEAVDDRVALLAVPGTNMAITYDDASGTLTFDATGGGSAADSFETVSKNLKAGDATFTYSGGDLSQIDYADGVVKSFTYGVDGLATVVLSGSTPGGIDLTKTLSYTSGELTGVAYT